MHGYLLSQWYGKLMFQKWPFQIEHQKLLSCLWKLLLVNNPPQLQKLNPPCNWCQKKT